MSYLPTTSPTVLQDPHLWTVEQYHRMFEAGVLREEDRVELLFGQIVKMSPIGRFHAACVVNIQTVFFPKLLGNYSWRSENPVILPDYSEPEPDFVVLDYRADNYAAGHPTAENVHLLIEVSDHTLQRDLEIKLPLYALAGICEYWVINLVDRQIERFTQPNTATGQYGQHEVFAETAHLSHPTVGKLSVLDILP